MLVYEVLRNVLKEISEKSFGQEREIQNIVEKNMDLL